MAGSGASVAKSENVLIRAGECTVTVLPQFGGKIASIRIGEQELLQQPLAPIVTRTKTMAFDAGDASGWDECLPSVATCSVETEAGVSEIPDHGDLWRVEWKARDQGPEIGDQADTSVTLAGECFSLPRLVMQRRIDLDEIHHGWRLRLSYWLKNEGLIPLPWSWAAHPLFAVEEGDRIVLPRTIKSLRLEGSGGSRLGKGGDEVTWPIAKLADGCYVDLSVADTADSGIGDKLFAGPLGGRQNWCRLERPSIGVSIRVAFDALATPYLGLWICYGGWPEKLGPKQVCVALEPATAPVDSLAVNGPWSRMLASGESFSWTMEVEIKQTER